MCELVSDLGAMRKWGAFNGPRRALWGPTVERYGLNRTLPSVTWSTCARTPTLPYKGIVTFAGRRRPIRGRDVMPSGVCLCEWTLTASEGRGRRGGGCSMGLKINTWAYLGPLMEGPQCRMSMLRNGNVVCPFRLFSLMSQWITENAMSNVTNF